MRLLLTTVVAVAALALAGAAQASPVQLLTQYGYTVGVAFSIDEKCTVWSVSGHGLAIYVNDCDPDLAATMESLTDLSLIYERDWQLSHPDQLEAVTRLRTLCYTVERTALQTDWFTVVGGTVNASYHGAQLPQLAASLPQVCHVDTPPAPPAPPPVVPPAAVVPPVPVAAPAEPPPPAEVIPELPPKNETAVVAAQLQQEANLLGLTVDDTIRFDQLVGDEELSPNWFRARLRAFKATHR